MKKFDLATLKANFTAKSGGDSTNNNYYPFWNMQVGQTAKVRFIPDLNENNPLWFLVKKMYHELIINGEKKKVACLKQYDPANECPICKAAAAYYKAEGKDSPNGKKYYRKLQYLGQILILEDPLPPNPETGETYKNTVKFVQLGTKIYDAIKDAFESDELEELPTDYKKGTNFIIKKTQSGEYADYTRSKFENKPSSLDATATELVTSSLIDLSTLLTANPGYEKVEAMFNAALKGSNYSQGSFESDDDDADADDDDVPSHPSPAVKPKASNPTITEPDDNVDEEAEAILASLRARKTAVQ